MRSTFARLRTHPVLKRFGKFGVVGATGVAINTALLWVLTHSLNAHYLIASPIAIECALCSNYLLNNNWTFLDRRAGFVTWPGLARYHAVSFGGLLINVGILHALVSGLTLPVIAANLIGIGVATIWNFGLSIGWTWRGTATRQTAVATVSG